MAIVAPNIYTCCGGVNIEFRGGIHFENISRERTVLSANLECVRGHQNSGSIQALRASRTLEGFRRRKNGWWRAVGEKDSENRIMIHVWFRVRHTTVACFMSVSGPMTQDTRQARGCSVKAKAWSLKMMMSNSKEQRGRAGLLRKCPCRDVFLTILLIDCHPDLYGPDLKAMHVSTSPCARIEKGHWKQAYHEGEGALNWR